MHFVYILYSVNYDKYYVGQTANIGNRIRRHNGGLNVSTKPYIPWELALVLEKESRSEALELERKLKNLSKQRIIAFLKKYGPK